MIKIELLSPMREVLETHYTPLVAGKQVELLNPKGKGTVAISSLTVEQAIEEMDALHEEQESLRSVQKYERIEEGVGGYTYTERYYKLEQKIEALGKQIQVLDLFVDAKQQEKLQ